MLGAPTVESESIEISAEDLALRCQEGCLESFEKLVDQFERRIVNFLNKMVNSRQDAEDLAQDTFVKAYKNIHRFDPKSQASHRIRKKRLTPGDLRCLIGV